MDFRKRRLCQEIKATCVLVVGDTTFKDLPSDMSCEKSEAYLESSRKFSIFAKIINGYEPLTIFQKSSIVDVRLGSKYASVQGFKSTPFEGAKIIGNTTDILASRFHQSSVNNVTNFHFHTILCAGL